MLIGQFLTRVNHSVHVRLHQIGDYINIFEASAALVGLLDVDELDDVLGVEEREEFNLSYDSFGVNEVFEGIVDFLDGDFSIVFLVISGADYAICTSSNEFDVFKLGINCECCACTD